MHDSAAAKTEFQKLIDHRSLIGNFIVGSLAHLGLARAAALSGDLAKARVAYQDFFALWKDADPGVPILNRWGKGCWSRLLLSLKREEAMSSWP